MRTITKKMRLLAVMMIAIFAFAASVNAQSTLLTESYENGGSVPAGWATETVSGSCPITFDMTSAHPTGFTAYDGSYMARFQSWSYSTGVTRLKMTTPISTVGYTNVSVGFAWLESSSYSSNDDRVEVQWSTDGSTWQTAETILRYNAVQGWTTKNVTLPTGAQEQATLYIAFTFTSEYGNDCYLDLATITAIGPPAPITITLGTSTSTTSSYPYNTYWHDERTQMLYDASSILSAGGSPGEISWIAYYVTSAASQTMNGFKIRMKNTTATSPSTWDNDMTTVFEGTYAVPGTGWQQITLQTPFVWDGVSNLLVEVCFDNTSYTSGTTVRYTNQGSTKTRYRYTDGAAGCSLTDGSTSTYTPNMQMLLTPWVGTLTGTVTNCFNGTALAGATVTAGSLSTTTDASGNYIFYNIPVGAYTIQCSAAGFLTQNKPATINNNQTTTLDFCMNPIPAYLSGLVYNNDTGEPIVGAKIVVGAEHTYSVAGGLYTLNIYPVGTFGVTANKAGFDEFTAGPFTFVQGVTELLDIPMLRTTYPPLAVNAELNSAETAVDIDWMAPKGMYEIRYDDGICDNFTVWAFAENMNAVKFTPVGYPAVVQGGKVHIGTIDNYPPGSNPLVPFQMAIYDATGANGLPGQQIGDPIDVTPSDYGWVEFAFPNTTITDGNFYLVMIQGGNAPNAAGICVDETDPQLRSYARFVTGGAPWIPASGNFMMRALVWGEGGPLVLDAMPEQGEQITASAVPGATYAHTPATVTGFEGKGSFETIEWASFNPSNTELPYISGSNNPQPAKDEYTGAPNNFTGGTGIPLEPTDAVLFNNGPLVNSAGTGAGGADESILENPPLTTLGFGFQNNLGNYMADDFTITGNSWNITSMEFFGYQTGSTTTSTFTGVFVQIWDGEPGTAGASVIWGDRTTNLMASTTWSNIYRNSDGPGGATNRPIMKVVASTPGLSLAAGTYWVEFSTTGSLTSGPWAPPVTISGQYTTGNAVQWTASSSAWAPAVSGTTDQQDLPFIINGFEVTPAGDIDYQVWRLQQGEETNPGLWTSIGQTNTLMMTDNSWPSLPCGPYRWAVRAIYQGNRISNAAFSNVIGKCNTAGVTINVGLTCEAHPLEGTAVQMVNNAYPDTNYMAFTDTNGTVFFPEVWKGNYTLTITRFTYDVYTDVFDVTGDMTIDVMLLQGKTPPSNLYVDDRSLLAEWNSPRVAIDQFNEDWNGGYGPNMWSETPSNSNWAIASTFGNPAPSAQFNWSPSITNYEQYLTSDMPISGVYAPMQLLKYDVYLSNFGTTTVENLAVELWDGSAWNQVDENTNQGGDIPWTTKEVDITDYNDMDTKIRFKAYGGDSYNINNWNIDNIIVYSTDGSTGYNPCVLGYNFYLNGVQVAFTLDTTYLIPANLVTYGQTYDACVNAVYGSGYSVDVCYTFTSHFLYPPTNLAVEGVECAAYLTWDKPETLADVSRLISIEPRTNMPNPMAEYSPMAVTIESSFTEALWDVLFAWPATDGARPGVEADMNNVYISCWSASFAPPWFETHEKMTGTLIETFDISGATAIRDLAYDGTYFYGSSATSTLYQMDFASHTLVSSYSTGASAGIRHISYDPNLDNGNGGFWCGNWSDMNAIAMDGTLLWSGPPMNSCYGNAFDDESTGGPFLWTFTQEVSPSDAIIRQWAISYSPFSLTETGVVYDATAVPGVDPTALAGGLAATPVGTKYALLANYQQTPNLVAALEIADYHGGGGDPAGLIGYNIYRDGGLIAYVSGKDTTWYYDMDVDPGTHMYEVGAWYDLTDYGFPGMFDESLLEGPVEHEVLCGRELPFCENWDDPSFSYHDWSFAPDQGNWSVTTAQGNPAPSADFGWNPITTDYSYALESDILNAGPWNCADLWLDYDIKLDDRHATGDEKLSVEVYWDGMWHPIAEYENNGSFGWDSYHHDISNAVGKAIRVRFIAHGDNTEDILHWYVDNICVYGVCHPPTELVGEAEGEEITLTWNAPACSGGGGPVGELVELYQHDGNPANGYYQSYDYVYGVVYDLAAYPDATLEAIDFHHASWGVTGIWDYKIHVVDWDTYTEIAEIGPLQTTGDDKWEENVSLGQIMGYGGGQIGIMLEPMSNDPSDAYPDFSADNVGPEGVSVYGPLPDYAALGVSTIGDFLQDLWIRTTFDDGLVAAPQVTAAQLNAQSRVPGNTNVPTTLTLNQNSREFPGTGDNFEQEVLGYNVWRLDPGATDYVLLTPTPQADTFYVDGPMGAMGIYNYYVTALFEENECESGSSDTVAVEYPAVGMNELGAGEIRIFPNPASEIVNIQSDYTIQQVEVMNFIGQEVYTKSGMDAKATKVNVTNLQPGVYFVKVTTDQGVRAVKITVTR